MVLLGTMKLQRSRHARGPAAFQYLETCCRSPGERRVKRNIRYLKEINDSALIGRRDSCKVCMLCSKDKYDRVFANN